MTDKLYTGSYTTLYNFRPGEILSMGKESLTVRMPHVTMEKFIESLTQNSSLKFEDDIEYILGTNEWFHNSQWTRYIGQPMFHIIDIKLEPEMWFDPNSVNRPFP